MTLPRKSGSLLTISIAVTAVLASLVSAPAQAQAPESERKIVIVTDILDDDMRALKHALSDPSLSNRIDSLVVSTGNTHLRAAVAMKLLHDFKRDDIPVYVGTSNDLSQDPATSFAARLDFEGAHILPEEVRLPLSGLQGVSGHASEAIASRLKAARAQGTKLDFIFMTAPTDYVKAVEADLDTAHAAVGNLYAMGFHKNLGNGQYVGPYNAKADSQALVKFSEYFQLGVGENFYHVPSDTVQKRTHGLPGGYFPNNAEGLHNRARLTALMKSQPSLMGFLLSAGEYGSAWLNTALLEFQRGALGYEWVQGSLKNDDAAAEFYVADMSVAHMASLGTPALLAASDAVYMDYELDAQHQLQIKPHAGQGWRPVYDLRELDGSALITRFLDNLERVIASGGIRNTLPTWLKPRSRTFQIGDRVITRADLSASRTRGLVVVFKNSSDDWMSLASIVRSEEGRRSLQLGGIICEGFEVAQMQRSLYGLFHQLGVEHIPVVKGYEYTAEELKNIPFNLRAEYALTLNDQAHRAFKDIQVAPPAQFADMTPAELLDQATTQAKQMGTKVDALVFGEGLDLYRWARASDATSGLWRRLGKVLVMGGGRKPAKPKPPATSVAPNELEFTRNWVTHTDEVLSGIEFLGRLREGVHIFSSDGFSGDLPAGSQTGQLHSSRVAMTEVAKYSNAVRALYQHWQNWSRGMGWWFGNLSKPAGEKADFDPNQELATVNMSPIALHMTRIWSENLLGNGADPNITSQPISMSRLREGRIETQANPRNRVFWTRRSAAYTNEFLVPIVNQFVRDLADIPLARAHDEAVRDHGLWAPEALQTGAKLEEALVEQRKVRKYMEAKHRAHEQRKAAASLQQRDAVYAPAGR